MGSGMRDGLAGVLAVIMCAVLSLSCGGGGGGGDGSDGDGDSVIRFEKTLGGTSYDAGYSVQETSDGGFIIAGTTQSFGAGNNDVYLVRTDAEGNMMWSKTFGGTGSQYGYSVQETSNGGFVIAGVTYPPGASADVYVVKTDADGNEAWSKTYGGTSSDDAWSVQETTDGGFVIAGSTISFGAGSYDIYLFKTDSDGNEVWAKTYGGTSFDRGYAVQETSDGGFVIAGDTGSFGVSSTQAFLVKTDAGGNEVWAKTYGGTGFDQGSSVQEASDGGFIVAGSTTSFGTGDTDIYLLRTDANGTDIWTKFFGGTDGEHGESVQGTADGGLIITGVTDSYGAGGGDVYLVKTDADGNELWSKTFGGTETDYAYSVAVTTDGGFIISGRTESYGAGGYDVYLIKTDANGDVE